MKITDGYRTVNFTVKIWSDRAGNYSEDQSGEYLAKTHLKAKCSRVDCVYRVDDVATVLDAVDALVRQDNECWERWDVGQETCLDYTVEFRAVGRRIYNAVILDEITGGMDVQYTGADLAQAHRDLAQAWDHLVPREQRNHKPYIEAYVANLDLIDVNDKATMEAWTGLVADPDDVLEVQIDGSTLY